MKITHSDASRAIKNWNPKKRPVREGTEKELGEDFTLEWPEHGYTVSITFSKLDNPDIMWVRSTNWRAEDEPHGLYYIQDCRDFYKRLITMGFIRGK
jgi:hypothetical protein